MFAVRTIYRFLTRTFVLYLGLSALSARCPIFFYPRKQISVPASEDFWRSITRRMIDPLVFKLDIWSQYENPEEGKSREGDIKRYPDYRKTFTTEEHLLWPHGIVKYFVDEMIASEPSKLAILHEAMETIMSVTCIRFIRIYPNENGRFPKTSWVNISGTEDGCYSDLGRTETSPSNINLDVQKCFRRNGHALHEILHTLGAFHEHMRPDRDEYIRILWENIKPGDEFNFRMMPQTMVTTHGLPYDYDSVMHYSMTAFSKDKSRPTIIPRKSYVEIGQRNHLSYYDIQKLLITYECNEQRTKTRELNIQDLSDEYDFDFIMKLLKM